MLTPSSGIAMHSGPLADLMRVAPAPAGRTRCGVGFMDLEIRSRGPRHGGTPCPGPGLYGLFFTPTDQPQRLIYAGVYRGTKKNPFSGNAAARRWWAHAASITMRSRHVSVPDPALNELGNIISHEPGHDFAALLAAAPEIATPSNCHTTGRRLRFAHLHWAQFGTAPTDQVLAPFHLVYMRHEQAPAGWDNARVRSEIELAESSMVAALRPFCNSEVPMSHVRHDVTTAEFEETVRSVLLANWH